MSTLKPWQGETPTLEEVATYLPQDGPFLTRERATSTSPEVRALGTWSGSFEGPRSITNVSVDSAIVEYGYWSHYRDREVIVTKTLFQVTEGGLAPDGWGSFDVYMVPRKLTPGEGEQMAALILAGLPVRVAGGEL